MLVSWVVVVAMVSGAPGAEARKKLDSATAEFRKQCGAASANAEVDLAAFATRYDRNSWLRDDSTAYERCAEIVDSLAATCRATREVIWPVLDKRTVENDRTLDLGTLAPIKKVRCTTPSSLPALEALVAQHKEWPESDRWSNAGKVHWGEDYRTARLSPEVVLKGDVLTLGYFSGTVNPGDAQTTLEVELVNAEYRRVTSGGPIGERGNFGVLKAWMDRSLAAFNKECGAKATVDVEWKELEKAWPGWDTWVDKGRDAVLEDVAVQGFVDRVLVDLADACANDGDEKLTALKKVKRFRVTADPRGARVMEVKRAKPKKSIESIRKELFPDGGYLPPSFTWQGDTITYGLWVEVTNPQLAREWLETEISKH